jgi:hypothetical protein
VAALGSLTPGVPMYGQVSGFFEESSDAELFRADCPVQIGFAIPVEVDIKPGPERNTIKLRSKGNVPVAILSTESFDAATVDPTTVTLAGAGLKVKGKGKGEPMYRLKDVNGDGRLDLVVHVRTQALELTGADESAELAGRTYAGVPIFGTDSVRVKVR